MSITFIDNVTPLDAVHMNALVQKDNVVAAATRIFASKLAAGDAQPAFQVNGNGSLRWGPGGSAAPDTTIDRIAAGAFGLTGGIYVQAAPLSIGFSFNPATFNANIIAFQSTVSGENARFVIQQGGDIHWGPGGATAVDTNLYRQQAGVLTTDSIFTSASDIYARQNFAGQVVIGNGGPASQAGMKLGSAGDTNLYRAAAGILKTDGQFWAAQEVMARNSIRMTDGPAAGMIQMGVAQAWDTNLYRNGAGQLKTDGGFYAAGAVGFHWDSAQWAIQSTINPDGWLFGGDTRLYRSAVGPFLEGSGFLTSAGVANVFVGCGPTPAYFPNPLTVGSLWYDTASTPQMLKLEALSQGVAWRDVGIAIGGGRLLTNTIVFGAGGSNFDTSLSRSAAGVLAVNGVPIGGGGAVMTGDYKVSAIAATHADPNGGSWLLCDGAPIPGGYAALIALVGGYTPDARGRVLTTVGANAAVNAVGKSDGVALANRRPQHQHTPHTHAASLSNGPVSHNSGSAAGTTTDDDSQYQSGNQIGVTVTAAGGGSGVATDSLDAPAFCVVGSLFIHT